jgi:hypothetical protein
MPTYRLIGDHDSPVETFTAATDADAVERGRELGTHRDTHWTVGYRVERADGDSWLEVATWLPRRRPGHGGMISPIS